MKEVLIGIVVLGSIAAMIYFFPTGEQFKQRFEARWKPKPVCTDICTKEVLIRTRIETPDMYASIKEVCAEHKSVLYCCTLGRDCTYQ